MANKKPTMNQVKNVINNILYEIDTIHKGIMKLDGVLSSYIDFMDNKKECKEILFTKQGRDLCAKWIYNTIIKTFNYGKN